MADVFNIAGRIHSTSQEEVVTGTNEILDETQGKKQSEVNQDVSEELALHTNRINALTAQNYVTVQATQSTTAADIPTLINATGDGEQTDTIYRVGFWDGSAFDGSKYSEYAWNGSAYVQLNVRTALGEIFDISEYNASGGSPATYANLTAALAGVPIDAHHGGMTVKFIQRTGSGTTEDPYVDTYVQYRLMATEWTTTVAQWQGVDSEIVVGSKNLPESGVVRDYAAAISKNNQIVVLEQGYYNASSAVVGEKIRTVDSDTRVRILPIKSDKCSISLNDGYEIRTIVFLDFELNFVSYQIIRTKQYNLSSLPTGANCFAFIIQKDDGNSEFSYNEDIVSSCVVGIDVDALQRLSAAEDDIGVIETNVSNIKGDLYVNVSNVVSSPVHNEDDSKRWNVSSETGEFVSAGTTDARATELTLTGKELTISYAAQQYSSKLGYAFLDDSNNLILGVKTTATETVTINALIPISQGATKFRCSNRSNSDTIPITIVKSVSAIEEEEKRADESYNDLDLTDATSAEQQKTQMNLLLRKNDGTALNPVWRNLTQKVMDSATSTKAGLMSADDKDVLDEISDSVFTESTETVKVYSPIYETQDDDTWNVSCLNGEFIDSTSAADIRATELELDGSELELSYEAHAYSGNFGYAFLDENDNFISGAKTTAHEKITVDAATPISQGATKFRCGTPYWKSDTRTITISVKKVAETRNNIDYLLDVVENGAKQPFSAEAIRLTFPTTLVIPYNVSGNNVDSVSFAQHIGCGLLGLAYDYVQAGKPSKLAIFFFGSGTYTNYNTDDFPSDYKPYIEYVRKCGYSVYCPYAWDETENYHNFGTPYSLGNFNKCIKYILENYNIDNSGVYIWGRSAGASSVLSFAYNGGMKIKSVALQHSLIGSIPWEHGVNEHGDNMVKKYIFDNDANYAWTEQYLTDNFHKLAPYETMFVGITDPSLTLANKVAFLLDTNTFSLNTWKNYVRQQPFPCKIWIPADDTGVSYNRVVAYFEQVIKSGALCEFRQMPSNYTDPPRVAEANPHHVCDTAGPVSDVTTSLGYECEDVPNAYIEMIDWFNRF